MKAGDLVKIAPRPFLGRVERIGVIVESVPENLDIIYKDFGLSIAVFVMGHVTFVGTQYLTVIKENKNA